MIFCPECHGFHTSAFVIIKGYNSITPLPSFIFMSAGGFHIKFQATTYTYPLPPIPSHLILSVMKSNILPFLEV